MKRIWCMSKSACIARPAFTLIELLVVVAIIVVLIAILLPSLGKARDQSKAAFCASNLRQIGTCFAMYLSENNDRIPHDTLKQGWKWMLSVSSSSDASKRVLYGYITNDKTAICPNDNRNRAMPIDTALSTYGTSYGMNKDIFDWSPSLRRIQQIEQPGEVILLGDMTMFAVRYLTWPGGAGRYTWHADGSYRNNILFWDYHVSMTDINRGYPRGVDFRWTATFVAQ